MVELLTSKILAKKLGVVDSTLYFWRLQGMPFVTVGRAWVRYDEIEVRKWCKTNKKKIKRSR